MSKPQAKGKGMSELKAVMQEAHDMPARPEEQVIAEALAQLLAVPEVKLMDEIRKNTRKGGEIAQELKAAEAEKKTLELTVTQAQDILMRLTNNLRDAILKNPAIADIRAAYGDTFLAILEKVVAQALEGSQKYQDLMGEIESANSQAAKLSKAETSKRKSFSRVKTRVEKLEVKLEKSLTKGA